jgi:ATPase subunit of ABC transporter with duplicated ATPase domains
MEAVDALEALQDFKGGIMVVSHDHYFVSTFVPSFGLSTMERGPIQGAANTKNHTAEATQKRVEESVNE